MCSACTSVLDAFDFATYRTILRWLSRDRPCVSFPTALEMRGAPYCLVRHDIDFSLRSAVRMAAVEAEMGISATYFLLFSAVHYNLLSADNRRIPRDLVAMGHEVGLHYDSTTVADLAPEQAAEILRVEAALLGELAGAPVRVVARHNPGFGGRDPMQNTEFISAYDPIFTREITYLSDSCGAWRDNAVEILTAGKPPANLQLLVHPIFWDEHAADRWTHLERLRRAQVSEIDAHAAAARAVWSAHSGVAEHDRRCGQAAPPDAATDPAAAGTGPQGAQQLG